jgi:2'-5' RNA ligase
LTVHFDHIGHFVQKDKVTFHAGPSDASLAQLRNVYTLLRAALPDVKVKRVDFVPHLTLGQCSKREMDSMTAKVTKLGLRILLEIMCELTHSLVGDLAW